MRQNGTFKIIGIILEVFRFVHFGRSKLELEEFSQQLVVLWIDEFQMILPELILEEWRQRKRILLVNVDHILEILLVDLKGLKVTLN